MFTRLLHSLTEIKDEELSQATARVVITFFAILYLLYDFSFSKTGNTLPIFIGTAYCIYSLIHIYLVYKYPGEYFKRRLVGIFGDLSILSLVLIISNETGSFFYPLYLWVIVGNGVRFGPKYLFIAIFYGLLSFSTVLYFGDFWSQHLSLGLGLLFAILILPLFYFVIIRRLHAQNEHLITQLKQSTFQALHDPLTKLPNRAFLLAQLSQYLLEKKEFYLLFIDLDSFKEVNDTLGHDIGDLVLQDVAKRLTHLVQNNEAFAARLGGDEFAIVVQNVDMKTLTFFAEKLLHELKRPYIHVSYIDYISASIGITKNNPSLNHDSTSLLRSADKAMYESKANGRNRFSFYQEF